MAAEILITKDLLGGLSKQQQLQQEKVSHDICSPPNSPLSSLSSENNQNHCELQINPDADYHELSLSLNHPPSSSSSTLQINLLFEETCLDLKLQSSGHYQSVCTLDKVKSALQRAEKETSKKRTSPVPPPSSAMFAACCPGCLLYVITLKTNPKCPRCNSTVPFPLPGKKAKIDLNASSFA